MPPASIRNALVSAPLTISVPAATSVDATAEVPLSVSAPAFCFTIAPVPSMAFANVPALAWSNSSVPLSATVPCASRLPEPPCSVAPASMVNALVSAPVTISEPPAASVVGTLETPLSVSAPAPCLISAPVPSMALANVPALAWSNASVPLSVTVPSASRLAEPPCSVAPASIVKPLVSAPVTISEPAATSVEATLEVPPSVKAPAFCFRMAPVPSMALANVPAAAWSKTSVPLSATVPSASRVALDPCSVAPASMLNALVSGPVTISVPAATSVEATLEVPLSVSAPAFSFTIAPVPSMALANVRVGRLVEDQRAVVGDRPQRQQRRGRSLQGRALVDRERAGQRAGDDQRAGGHVGRGDGRRPAQRQRAGVLLHDRAGPVDGVGERARGRLVEQQRAVVGDRPLRQQVARPALQRRARVDGERAGQRAGDDQRAARHLGGPDRRGSPQRPRTRPLVDQRVEVDEVIVGDAGPLQDQRIGRPFGGAAGGGSVEDRAGLERQGVRAGAA